MSLVDKLLGELEAEPEKARRLARKLAADIVSEEHLRTLLLEGLVREAATRQDLGKLEQRIEHIGERMATREDIVRLEQRIDHLESRMDTLIKWIIGLLVTIWGTVAVIGLAMLKTLAH